MKKPIDDLPALTRAPAAPRHFSAQERRAWSRLWKVLLPLRKVGAADVLVVEQCARAQAALDVAWKDPTLKVSTLVSMVRLQKELLRDLGLTPASRRSVEKLADPKHDGDDPLAEFDR